MEKQPSYGPQELITDLENGLWKELGNPQKAIDPFRRSLQKQYVDITDFSDEPIAALIARGIPPGD